MTKHLPTVSGIILGLLFLLASVPFLLHLVPEQKFPEGSPVSHFMDAFGPTGYMILVKVCELVGAVLVMIPRTRNWGLLVLGPILVNILAFTVFIMKGDGLLNPMLDGIVLLMAYLLWHARRSFLQLLN
jgi:hypothetical protein